MQSLSENTSGEAVRSTGIDKSGLELLAEIYGEAGCGVIIYGEKFLQQNGAGGVVSVLSLAAVTGNKTGDKLRVLSLKRWGNSRGAWESGLADGIQKARMVGLYLLLGDEPVSDELQKQAMNADFLVVQAAYQSTITDMADIVLPSLTWAEREGTGVAMDGRSIKLQSVLKPANNIPMDEDIFIAISDRLTCKTI